MNDEEDLKRRNKDKKRNNDEDEDGEGGGIFDTILEFVGKILGK